MTEICDSEIQYDLNSQLVPYIFSRWNLYWCLWYVSLCVGPVGSWLCVPRKTWMGETWLVRPGHRGQGHHPTNTTCYPCVDFGAGPAS